MVVIHRPTLCENVDSVKIKVTFYTTDIDILRVASMHRIVIHCIDESLHLYETERHNTIMCPKACLLFYYTLKCVFFFTERVHTLSGRIGTQCIDLLILLQLGLIKCVFKFLSVLLVFV